MMIRSCYVASSWRNPFQVAVVAGFRSAGIKTYDFKDIEGFHWTEVDPTFGDNLIGGDPTTAMTRYQAALGDPRSIQGFRRDMTALREAEATVLVLPCGRSAHLELGWAVRDGQATAIYAPNFAEEPIPELMYRMVDLVTDDFMALLTWAGVKD